jgi:hypothetical protein
MNNPYPKIIVDEATGLEFVNDKYRAYNEGRLSMLEEVIAWIEPLFHFYDCPESECPIYNKWQSKLKEWGIT